MVAVGIHREGTWWLVIGGTLDERWGGIKACGARMPAGECAVSVVLVRAVPVLCLMHGAQAWGGFPCQVICRRVGSHGW